MVLSLVFGALRFHFALHPDPLLLPAVFLVGLTATAVGHMLALVATNQTVASMLNTLVVFFVLMFSPIAFPSANLPGWFAVVHRVLPIEHMATLVRATLTGQVASVGEWAAVCAWCAVTLLIAATVSPRRDQPLRRRSNRRRRRSSVR
jgi:ABC-2 type transport system permease protein